MKVIARFYLSCGRMGDVHGIFTCTKEELEAAYGKEFYFGEILGKHSEIYGELDEEQIEIVTDEQEFIEKFEYIMGSGTISGYNPLEYLQEEDEEDEEDEE